MGCQHLHKLSGTCPKLLSALPTTSPLRLQLQYSGPIAAATKAVQDAAQGGMVLLSESTMQGVRMAEHGYLWAQLCMLRAPSAGASFAFLRPSEGNVNGVRARGHVMA